MSVAMHFTYDGESFDKTILKQGDLLTKTPELNAILEKYHNYFSKDQYTHFLVLTQTCDLILRKGGDYKARYITLAAVRPLEDAIEKQLAGAEGAQTPDGRVYFSDRHREKLTEFLRKLHNNNDPHHFFLKAAPDHGLTNDSCSFLQLSVPIKTIDHYKTCCAAKCLQLNEGFRAKLGFLVGDLYSRVGTEDYVPGALPDSVTFDKYLIDTLSKYVNMVPGKKFSKFQQYAKEGKTFEEIDAKVTEEIKQSREQKLNSLVKLVKTVVTVTPEQESQLKNSLAQNATLKSYIEK